MKEPTPPLTPVQRVVVVAAVLATLGLPYAGSVCKWGSPANIPGFGDFPPQRVLTPPGFDLLYFVVACAVVLVMIAFLLVPALFGFKPAPLPPPSKPGPFPSWFWVGGAICLVSWYMMWWSGMAVVKYLFTALWWGFIAVLDGIVYRRTGGSSIFSRLPKQMFWLGVTSLGGWWAFEWLNYFVLENWTYPNSPAIFTRAQAIFWFSLTYTCVFPAIFEIYTLLRTFPALEARWARGPVIAPSRGLVWLVLLAGCVGAWCVGYFPFALFFVVWIASLLVLPEAMGLVKLWTPFNPLAVGNWTPMVLCAVASLFTGFFWEMWNHGSNVWHPGLNPNYWVYDVPYVNVVVGFTEMPLLGYFGYLPFGVQCWVWWLVLAHLLNLPVDFDPQGVGLPGASVAAPAPSPRGA
ncbi:MAG TPA: hypothetical protein VF765_11880 [Polyangiaceae bacterium]